MFKREETVARARYVLELVCAFVSGGLAVLTVVVHDWIEVAFGVSPDRGSGLTEVAIVGALVVLCVALAADVNRMCRIARARA
jgi:hypothetical protein